LGFSLLYNPFNGGGEKRGVVLPSCYVKKEEGEKEGQGHSSLIVTTKEKKEKGGKERKRGEHDSFSLTFPNRETQLGTSEKGRGWGKGGEGKKKKEKEKKRRKEKGVWHLFHLVYSL